MKLKKDWSLAYLLYYFCQIGFWLILLNLLFMMFFNSTNYFSEAGKYFIHDIPVTLNTEEAQRLGGDQEGDFNINMYSTVKTRIGIDASFEKYGTFFFYYNGLQAFKTIIFLIVVFFFAKVLRNVAEGTPFDSSNPKYLYIIGWTLFSASVLNLFTQLLPTPLLSNIKFPGGLEFSSVQIFQDYMLEGIFIIVLGYVFKEGTRIYEEQKLTV